MELDFIAAFMIGLLGSGHCIGMCGGMGAAITLSIDKTDHQRRYLYLLLYNFGRIVSYCLLGGVIGALVTGVTSFGSSNSMLIALRLCASMMMILLACYIGGWWFGLTFLEKQGQKIWRYIAPIAGRLLPLKSPIYALPLGFLWGWLPCGLVYSALTWAAVSGSALNGSSIMLAFGLGTLPALLLVGFMADTVKSILKNRYIKHASALLLLFYGIQTGYIAIKQLM